VIKTDEETLLILLLQNIFKLYGEEYLKKHNIPSYIRKTLADIESCRTSQLGGNIDQCDDCGDIYKIYCI